jgi:hypothetical protein
MTRRILDDADEMVKPDPSNHVAVAAPATVQPSAEAGGDPAREREH